MKSFSNKKAQDAGVGMSTTTVIGIVLAVIALSALIFLTARLANTFFSGNKQDYVATKNNFDELVDKVQEMLDKDGLVVERFFPYYIHSDYTIVGFDGESNHVFDYIGGYNINPGLGVFKPSLCYEKACLCLYKGTYHMGKDDAENEQNKDENVLSCKSFEGNIIFYTQHRTKIANKLEVVYGKKRDDIGSPDEGHSYRYFILNFNKPNNPKWNIQNLYIEKKPSEYNRIHMFIRIEDSKTEERYQRLFD